MADDMRYWSGILFVSAQPNLQLSAGKLPGCTQYKGEPRAKRQPDLSLVER
jgi:hypothetical protein